MRKYYQLEERCCANVYHSGGRWGGSRCERKWKVEDDGKHYCIQHSPVKVQERRDVWKVKYDVESKARKIQYALEYGRIKACKDVPIEYLKEGILRKLIDFAYEMDNAALIAELEKE